MIIDKETHKISDKNYIKKVTNKDLIILGDTCRKDSNHIIRMKHKEFGISREWNTYTISRDGKIFEHYNPKYYSEYSGDKNIDRRSIVILFENMNVLFEINDKYFNWINEECDNIHNIYRKLWKTNNYYWEKYTNEQYNSFVDLAIYLIEEFDIPKKIYGSNIFFSDSYNYKGILSKSNLSKDDIDINPSFEYENVSKLLINKFDEFLVD